MSAIQQMMIAEKIAAGGGSISFVASSISTSGTVTKPSGTTTGDFIVIFSSATTNGVWTPPSGFTDLTGGASSIVGSCYKQAGASEPGSYSYSIGASFEGMVACSFRGASAVDVIGANASATGVTSLTLPSVTTTTSADMLIAGCGSNVGVSMNGVSGMTRVTAASNPPVAIYYELLSASGATGTRTVPVGGGSADLVGGMFALKP